jgi:hypothetical protein
MPKLNTLAGGGYSVISACCKGGYHQTDYHTVDAGKNLTFQDEGNFGWLRSGGDLAATSSGNGIEFSGKNGKDHSQHLAIGRDSGLYPREYVTGFKFKANQNSGAGHGLYIRKFGFKLRKTTNTDSWFYGAGGSYSRGDYGTKSYNCDFDSDTINKLENGYCFYELHLEMSTKGGSGDRTTAVNIYDFTFKFKTAPFNNTYLIRPIVRPYNERHLYKIA